MPALSFVLGYILLGIGAADLLSQYDSEPLGAFASLLLFVLLSALTTAVALLFAQATFQQHVGKFKCLVLGAVCSITFSLSAGTTYLGLGFAASITLAFVIPPALAASTVFAISRQGK